MKYAKTFFDEMVPESLSSAKIIVPLVMDLLHPTSVVDVGCATGAWLSVFREHGVEDIIGIDGTYVDVEELLIPKKCFYATNLANPFSLSKRYDLALALEVAEHLPRFSAKHFVHCLCKLAAVVLFFRRDSRSGRRTPCQ
jgi:2-polyprenyl-3-methyl-5-hydroxy-6-metoxy-1,4-benzoquinol methylase